LYRLPLVRKSLAQAKIGVVNRVSMTKIGMSPWMRHDLRGPDLTALAHLVRHPRRRPGAGR
jgi:hypothetical protein